MGRQRILFYSKERLLKLLSSDLTLWKKGGFETFRNEHPYVLGHEGAGEVVGVGSDVQNFSVGK